MTKFVVDASVAAKWYLPENFSDSAVCLLDSDVELLAPDLLFSEIGNVLWKRVMKSECTYGEAVKILDAIETVPLKIWDTRVLMSEALDIACRTKRTFYDSLYISLAVREKCKMVTADAKLYNTLAKLPFKKNILWVEDVK